MIRSKSAGLMLLVVPLSVAAQEPTSAASPPSPPFRSGQWAAQFAGGSSFASLGVIKFRSPTSAMVLDLRVSGAHREQFVDDTLSSIFSQASIDLRVGRRWYRPIADKIVGLHSLGVLVGFDHSVGANPSLGRSSFNGWDAGPFAELGAVYLVTPHFGIGATGTVLLTYSRSSGESPGGFKTRSWQLGGGTGISFAATIYF